MKTIQKYNQIYIVQFKKYNNKSILFYKILYNNLLLNKMIVIVIIHNKILIKIIKNIL